MSDTAGIEHIQWQRPWLAPWVAVGEAVAAQVQCGAPVHKALNAHVAAARTGVRFVPQTQLPTGMAYEQFIFQERCVPTRDNLHDFFNGLAWLQFPQIKNRLNALQAEHIAQAGVGSQRGRVRDALTLIDENAAFLIAPAALHQALQTMDWAQLFGPLRPLWQSAQLIIFGHALLEKLVQPRKAMVAHVLRTWPDLPLRSSQDVDAPIAAWLGSERLTHKPFAPLPVLGVPLWWPGNADPAFYQDPLVFRQPGAALARANTRSPPVPMTAGP